jgi:NADH dehydrogenase
MLTSKNAIVFGGTGFIGRYVVRRLADLGYTVRIPTRNVAEAGFLRTTGVVGQINPVQTSLHDVASIRRAIGHPGEAEIVVNLIGQLTETRRRPFHFIQGEVPGRIARAAAELGVAKFVQVSAIGAEAHSKSAYADSKAAGEAAVKAAFPAATIMRPSIVFGPEDEFFNRFAAMARVAPALPLIGGGRTRFQPVYVDDLAAAIVAATQQPQAAGQTYELGGPAVLTFRELMEKLLAEINLTRALLPIPFPIAMFQARFTELIPGKPLTRDQVELLKRDNVASGAFPGLADLGIVPTALDAILPHYLDRFRKGGRFQAGPHAESAYY